jgi:hypothetical protein
MTIDDQTPLPSQPEQRKSVSPTVPLPSHLGHASTRPFPLHRLHVVNVPPPFPLQFGHVTCRVMGSHFHCGYELIESRSNMRRHGEQGDL